METVKQRAKRSISPMAWSLARNSKAPASEVILRHQTRPPLSALQCVQIRTAPRYTLSASGLPQILRQTVELTRFSQNWSPDAPTPFEKSGLARIIHEGLAAIQ
jgi:hypothetical protein